MKKLYTVKFLFTLVIAVFAMKLPAQIIVGGVPARFGIDADVKSNLHSYGTSMPAPAGSDDWFNNTGGSGLGVIDTSGATSIKTKLQAGENFLFEMPMAFAKFSTQNSIVMLDARYAHDNVGTDSTTFSQGKNGDDPSTWVTSPNGSVMLDKSDIVDTYIHLRRNGNVISGPNPSPLILIMGGSVYSSTGNHYMDFELYKNKIQYDRSTGKFSNSGPTSTGGHTRWEFRADGSVAELGDMQVSFSFSSASVSSLNIYIWVSLSDYNSVTPQKFDFVPNTFFPGTLSGYGYAEVSAKAASGALPVWGIVNSTGTSAAPFWGTNSKTGTGTYGYSTTYGTGEFAEVAIDLTALGTDPALNPYNNPCNPPFRRMLTKSRSSSSFSAALKDFTGPYEFVDDPMVVPDLIPPTTLTCYSPTVNINPKTVYPSPAIYEWSTSDGNIKTRTDSTAITIDKKGTYVLKTRSAQGCSSRSDSVLVDADQDKPNINAGGPYFINKNSNVAIKANPSSTNNPGPFGGSQGLTWQWTGPNSFSASTQTINAADSGTYLVTATEIRNGCSSSSYATVMFLSALPVRLNNFGGILINKNTADLKWSINSEDGNESYTLERSTDGIHFSQVYNTKALRVSSESNYGYRDDLTGITGNIVFYKVKIYSHSVSYSESNIIKLNLKDAPSQQSNHIISVVQNGNSTSPEVNYYSVANNTLMSLIVSDLEGKIIYRTQQQVNSGLNTIKLPSTFLKIRGVKVLAITLGTDKMNYKFIYN